MKKILAIGGAVIKTAKEELREYIEKDNVEMLIHNGGSIFHDFQQETDSNLNSHSYSLDDLIKDYSCNEPASKLVWGWVKGNSAPKGTITNLCTSKNIPVLLFTAHACDFWQMFSDRQDWETLAKLAWDDYKLLVYRFKSPFYYICMGSAVIHPEVFTKAIAESKARDFISDVVDFKDMYRPRTRVSIYGTYHQMSHKQYLKMNGG